MNNAANGARIKVWPGLPSELSADLQGGGGTGAVNNITYEKFVVNNVDYALEITQCYGQSNLTLCNEYPSNLTISNVLMKDFTGTTSTKFNPISGYLVCSSPTVCNNIIVEDIDVVSPADAVNEFKCTNIPLTGIQGINCTSINKGQS
jgi:galacturan 1,4-alpha-galacturonidase